MLSRARSTGADVRWVHGDFMTHPLPVHHFQLVAAVATVHHAPDLASALARLAALAAPDGRVVVIGCARPARVRDYLVESFGVAQHHVLARTRGFWQHSAPVQMRFPLTYAETRDITDRALPGARWRQLPLFRYRVVWTKPA